MVHHDIAIIGGGVVGCSTAKFLAEKSSLDICLLEKEYQLGLHQSGRNSGVLHPGFNYPPDSIKATYATAGTRALKAYAQEHCIPVAEFGVVVVAQTAAEIDRLHELESHAEQNGVDVDIIDADRVADLEPAATGRAGLYCPAAASIDSQKYLITLATEAELSGVDFYMGYHVQAVRDRGTFFRIETESGTIRTDYLINCAGLHADRIAHQLDVGTAYQVIPFRGEYYELIPDRRDVCNSMIYPTPDPDLPFLGVHFTRRTDDKVIVGPNAVPAFGREAYRNTQFSGKDLWETLTFSGTWKLLRQPKMASVARAELHKSYRKQAFVTAAQQLVPSVTTTDFRRSYAGIRAQLVNTDGALINDPLFEFDDRSLHVLNAVSPGLTSSLPVGEWLADETLERFDSRP